MNKKEINTEEELWILIADYKKHLLIKSDEEKRHLMDLFYRFIWKNYLHHLGSILNKYKTSKYISPYNFYQASGRNDFVMATLGFKIADKDLLKNIDPEVRKLKNYLSRIIENAALTLIRENQSKIEIVHSEENNKAGFTESAITDDSSTTFTDLVNDYPLLFDESQSELKGKLHIFVCNKFSNFESSAFLVREIIDDERILKWRSL